jgi:hypothetical protein
VLYSSLIEGDTYDFFLKHGFDQQLFDHKVPEESLHLFGYNKKSVKKWRQNLRVRANPIKHSKIQKRTSVRKSKSHKQRTLTDDKNEQA